jgi:hypothetical protein
MGCGCCGGPVIGPSPANATTVQYTPAGYLAWWSDSALGTNVGHYLGGAYYEAHSASSSPVLGITKIDITSGVRFKTRSIGDAIFPIAVVVQTDSIGEEALIVIAALPQVGAAYTVLVSRIDPETLLDVWSVSVTGSFTSLIANHGLRVVGGEHVFLKDTVAGVAKVRKYTNGSLVWTINASDPGGGDTITNFGDQFDGSDIAVGGTGDGAWKYDSAPSIVATWNPTGTADGWPSLAKKDGMADRYWVANNARYVALDSNLSELFAPATVVTPIVNLFADATYGAMYVVGDARILRIDSTGALTTRWDVGGGSNFPRGFVYTGDQQEFFVRHTGGAGQALKKYDDTSAPASVVWTVAITLGYQGDFYQRHSTSMDESGNIYITGNRAAVSGLTKVPS